MNWVFRLIVLSIAVNLATGIVVTAFPVLMYGNTESGPGIAGYDSSYTADLENDLGVNVSPSAQIEDQGSLTERIFDFFSIGFIFRLLELPDRYMFGFVNLVQGLMEPQLADSPGLSALIFGGMKTLIGIAYAIAAIALITGRNPFQG